MVDFKRLLAEQAARRTPEQQARYEQREARLREAAETAIDLSARFTPLGDNRPTSAPVRCAMTAGRRRPPPVVSVQREAIRPVTMRILVIDDPDGERREVVEFSGTPTGTIRYTLDARFCEAGAQALAQDQTTPFTLCFGRKNQYEQCEVDLVHVVEHLRLHRPQLFEAPSPGLSLPQP